MDWIANFTEADLGRLDIGTANLRCAAGLPGTEGVDLQRCCRLLDHWTGYVTDYTQRNWRRYERRPSEFWDSPAKYRVLAMVTALQRELGVKYDQSTLSEPIDLRNALPWFACGPITGRGGTCVSLPVVYAAIGRRLGYPLFFVRAKEHLFLRWEEPGERFNIECTSPGFEPHSDAHFHFEPRPLSDEDLETGLYLRNLSRQEEIALCFLQRGHCLLDNLRADEALVAYGHATRLCPGDPLCGFSIGLASAIATRLDYERARSDFDRVVPSSASTPLFVAAKHELARIRGLHARDRSDRATHAIATSCFFAGVG